MRKNFMRRFEREPGGGPGAALGLGAGFAQDFGVNGDGIERLHHLGGYEYQPPAADKIGVQGYSVPVPYYGIGVNGIGGWMGFPDKRR